MARLIYGGSPADWTIGAATVTDTGAVNRSVATFVASVTLSVWDAASGGSAVTDLQDLSGASLAALISTSAGLIPAFQGPDSYTGDLWVSQGAGTRFRLAPSSSGVLSLANYGNIWTPNDHGFTAWTFDPGVSSSSGTTLSAGYIYMLGILLRQATTISKLNIYIGTAGATLTSGQCLAGLYNASGTRVGITADMSTTWNSTGHKAMNLTSSYAAAAGRFYVALLFNGTTSPTVACGSTQGATFTPGNSGLSAGSYRWCRSASGQTALPSSVTLSGYTADANNIWAAVS
ncbi:hypothetical protein [Streptomyces arenae]|uniref:hypothetical protein n=1 Tax=Streptomyces arenae TaxID=29301 RepID=UPI002658C082|nr:hypothetical protein [Streptomyces arenae]MCG7203958.1 hypothetical protein [Streptomyces arenae]